MSPFVDVPPPTVRVPLDAIELDHTLSILRQPELHPDARVLVYPDFSTVELHMHDMGVRVTLLVTSIDAPIKPDTVRKAVWSVFDRTAFLSWAHRAARPSVFLH